MGIKSVRIKNLLSFDDVFIKDIKDINCIIGQNNTGKSNLLNLLQYFYNQLSGVQAIPPKHNSSYSPIGSISITYDTTRIKRIVTSKGNSPYQKHIYNTLFRNPFKKTGDAFLNFILSTVTVDSNLERGNSTFELKLQINRNGSTSWSTKNKDVRDIINRIYPFFSIDTRRIDLYDWGKLWDLVSHLKFINTNSLKRDQLVNFIDENVSKKSGSYRDYVNKIEKITSTSSYSYQEKVLNYVKVGLEGHTFNIEGNELNSQSDGTNSHKYIELFLNLLIALTRREFITPTVYIDEPEIGLHPKRSEELIYRLNEIYRSFQKTKDEKEIGRYKTPYPKIILATHSPNIVKSIVKYFRKENEHQVLHFSKEKSHSTNIRVMKSHFDDRRFLNVFSDNEARLFFSSFILFVEGETELELFGNIKLANNFPKLRKIDTYKANDLTMKPINPSFSNLAIPYLKLFDADLLIETNLSNGTFKFQDKKLDLKALYKKYQCSYYGSKSYKIRSNIKSALRHEGLAKTLTPNNLNFDKFKYEEFIRWLNNNILIKDRTLIASTTIEGSLINDNSITILFHWLINEFIENIQIGGKGDVKSRINNIAANYPVDKSVGKHFSKVFAHPPSQDKFTGKQLKIAKLVKLNFLNNIKVDLKNKGLSEKEIVIVFRLVFGGKTNTLIKLSKSTKTVPKDIVELVFKIREIYLRMLPYKVAKASGWVTSFMNFSIDYITQVRCKENGTSFNTEFEKIFPELYDIIDKASFWIE